MDKTSNPALEHKNSSHEAFDIDIEAAIEQQLSERSPNSLYRYLRWNFFSVYRRIFAIVFIANFTILAIAFAFYALSRHHSFALKNLVTAVSANLLTAIVIRNEHVINLLFRIAVSVPQSAPLFWRRLAAKVYSYGGLHSGCGVAATAWYALFAARVVEQFVRAPSGERHPEILVTTLLILFLLVAIVMAAHPRFRESLHNHFEWTHRFAGWTVVLLFWVQLILLARIDPTTASITSSLVKNPTFYFLIIISLLIIYPWARLRSHPVRVEALSKHATRLHFDHATHQSCMVVKLSDRPLKENHSFATIPNPEGARGFSIVVSHAGDWTRRIIDNTPSKLYIRSGPQFGVLRTALLFSPVIIVATGSGIGPCLGLFNGHSNIPCRILWSTRDPEQTYGTGIIEIVKRADPNAVIWDTSVKGRPDMVALTYGLFKESEAEAVVCISNPALTRKVVFGMESRGVPAYGPIWDS
ncbi:hypothetical protein K432DRAFT_420134 [Lepidopterella palustris CBS 459.81]|uniref:Integral membrane protein TmpA n=1 Tax=Lepidopterella palustris CBS 459.81 TaxID=1314670 RepID=A0A8E2JA15_9PEZI|nr:hypothetical protein K432DRAFT_420134 [Lepidopterella palustris CBS 459.81]